MKTMKKILSILITISLLASMISVMSVHAADGDIDEAQWAVYEDENFEKNRWLVPYYSYYGNRNSTYGFAFQGYTGKSSEWANARYSNNFMAMPKGINGDFIVDFDLFVDDVEVLSDGTALLPQFDSWFRTSVYGGELTADGNYKKVTTKLMNNETIFSWSGSLKNDNNVEYPYKAALASSKYITAPEDGTPSWIDVRMSVIENTLTVYAKWNTASNWKILKTYSIAEYSGARGLCFHGGANVGFDNFKLYQKSELVVNETFESGTQTWKDVLSLKKTDYIGVTSEGYLRLGYNQNLISTIDSYSDYIIQFDYNPYYYNIANDKYPRMIFTIGGYEFHMRSLATGISAPQGVTSGATITKENDFSFINREWSTIRVKKIDKEFWFYAKNQSDDDFTLIYKGTFAENKTAPFKFNTYDTSNVQSGHTYDYQAYMDNLKIWNKSFLSAVEQGLYDVNPGKIVVTFDKMLEQTISDTVMVNDFVCKITRENDTTATIIIPDGTLDYSTDYVVDLGGIKSTDGSVAKNIAFTTIDNPVPDDFNHISEISYNLYEDGNSVDENKYISCDGADKVAVLTSNGSPVKADDFVLSFDYTDTSELSTKYLAVIFGLNPNTEIYSEQTFFQKNNFNGLAGISTENENKYKLLFGNEAEEGFVQNGGTVHDFAIEKDSTYNVKVSYLNNIMTLYIKKSTENLWKKYTKTMTADYAGIESGYIAILNNASGVLSNIKLYDTPTESTLSFEDDFNEGLQKWMIKNDSIYCQDGMLKNNFVGEANKICDAVINIPYDNLPINPVIKIRFSLASGSWLRFILPSEDGNVADIMLRREQGFFDYTTNSEVKLKNVVFEKDVMYDISIKCTADKVKIYYKKASDVAYERVGEIERNFVNAPKLRIYSYAMNFNVDKVEIFRSDINDFCATEGAVYINVGESVPINYTNNTNQKVIWSTLDSGIATVNDGVLNGISKGNTVVKATTEDGNYSFSLPVICLQEVEKLTLSHSKLTIQEGEVINLSASFAPSGVSDKTLVWESSDESVVSLFGNSRREKTIKAEGVGCAVVSAKATFGDVVGECMVTVIPSKTIGTASVIFSASETKTPIEPLLFGMHRSPQKGQVATNELYNDLGVKSLRSFLNTSEVTVEDNLDASNTNGIPHIVALTEFATKTVSELVEIVKEVKANASANDVLYIEMGNEVYDGTMGISAYIAKCKEFYNAVKAYDSTAKIGIVAVPQDLVDDSYTWNDTLKNDRSFYDAVIVHNYGSFYDHNNLTRKDMADSMYAWNKYIENSLYNISEEFPDKDIWVTEYGHLQLNMFNRANSEFNEINRIQVGKSVGAALSNVEKLLDMAESGKVKISNYHYDNDSQGFGVIQGSTKLPNYYTFKKAGELLNGYTNMFNMSAIKNDVKNSAYRIKDNPKSSNIGVNSVECWGFGGESIEKVVIANHNSESVRFSLSDYKLKKEWSYGGENAFSDFLLWNGTFSDLPYEVALPDVFSGEAFVDVIELEPYSMMVCEVSQDTSVLTAAFNVADGSEDVLTDKDITVTFSKDINVDLNEYLTVTADGDVVQYNILKTANNKYKIIPEGGVKSNTNYLITLEGVEGMSSRECVSFTTYNPILADCFTQKVNIKDLKTDNYEITFRASGEINFTVRNVPIYIQDGIVYYKNCNSTGNNSMYPGVNLRVLGHYGFAASKTYFKIVVYGTEISVYARASVNENYEYVGTIYNVEHSLTAPSFDWYTLLVGGVEVKINPNPMTSLEFSVTENGEEFYSNTMLPGENNVNMVVDSGVQVIYAEYDENGTFVSSKLLMGSNEYSFTSDNNGLTKKIFVWDGLDTMKPLQSAIFAD